MSLFIYFHFKNSTSAEFLLRLASCIMNGDASHALLTGISLLQAPPGEVRLCSVCKPHLFSGAFSCGQMLASCIIKLPLLHCNVPAWSGPELGKLVLPGNVVPLFSNCHKWICVSCWVYSTQESLKAKGRMASWGVTAKCREWRIYCEVDCSGLDSIGQFIVFYVF